MLIYNNKLVGDVICFLYMSPLWRDWRHIPSRDVIVHVTIRFSIDDFVYVLNSSQSRIYIGLHRRPLGLYVTYVSSSNSDKNSRRRSILKGYNVVTCTRNLHRIEHCSIRCKFLLPETFSNTANRSNRTILSLHRWEFLVQISWACVTPSQVAYVNVTDMSMNSGPRVFVKTSRSFDPHDKLVREYYKLDPYINGMVKNGRRNFRHEVSNQHNKWSIHRV